MHRHSHSGRVVSHFSLLILIFFSVETNSWWCHGMSVRGPGSEAMVPIAPPQANSVSRWRSQLRRVKDDIVTFNRVKLSRIPQYQYTALPSGKFFRYIVLSPGIGTKPLKCRLVVAEIDNAPSFDAVSYTWGSAERNFIIPCNHASLKITWNLTQVLRRVRLPAEERNVWVDQICIDQENRRERGHQVGLMGEIYKHAQKVLIWLGGSDSDGARVVALISEVNEVVKRELTRSSKWSDITPSQSDDPLVTDTRWKAFDLTLQNPWFTRTWVIQEVGLAANPRVLIGDSEVEWHALTHTDYWRKLCAPVDHFRQSLASIHYSTLAGWGINAQRPESELESEYRPKSLIELLYLARRLDANEPRDHIYSFLGHPLAAIESSTDKIIAPDYISSLQDVTVKFAEQWLTTTRDLQILSAVENNLDNLVDSDNLLPSWVPKWHATPLTHSIGFHSVIRYNTTGGLPSRFSLMPDAQLKVTGIIFDTISYRSERLGQPDAPLGDSLTAVWSYLAQDEPPTIFLTTSSRVINMAQTLSIGTIIGQNEQFLLNLSAFCSRLIELSGQSGTEDVDTLRESARRGNANVFLRFSLPYFQHRVFLRSQKDLFYGLGPPQTQVGDLCCAIFGCNVPFIIRKVQDGYKLVGEAYIHGMMKGEIKEMWDTGQVVDQDIILV